MWHLTKCSHSGHVQLYLKVIFSYFLAWIYSHWKEDVLSCKSALTLFWFIYFQLLKPILSCFGHMLTTPLQFHLSISFNFFYWVLTFNHGAPQQMKCLRAAIQEINTWHVLKSCQSKNFKYSKVLNITEKKNGSMWIVISISNYNISNSIISKMKYKNSQNLDVFVTFLYYFDLAKCGWLDFAWYLKQSSKDGVLLLNVGL